MKKLLLLLFIATSFALSQNMIWTIDEKHENGFPEKITYYKKTLKHISVVKIENYYENGQIEKEENYKKGEKHSKHIEYFENGQIREEINFKDGEMFGQGTAYYENGQISIVGNFKGGKREGKWTWYYENGQIKQEGNGKDGKEDGKWTYYNEDGSIDKIEEYKDGELIEDTPSTSTFSNSSTSKTENIDICRCLIEPGNTQWYKDNANTCRDAISEKIGVPNWETINFSQNPILDAKWEELKTSCGH